MLASLVKTIQARVNTRGALKTLARMQSIDRVFTFPAFHDSAKRFCREMKDAGLSTRIYSVPADGRTRAGDWIMPLAWDIHQARVTIVSPAGFNEPVICDRAAVPASVVMWCGPTPKGGMTAPLVPVNTQDEITAARVRGKIILTPLSAIRIRRSAIDNGALAIVSFFLPPRAQKYPDAVFWNNAWSDQTNGWSFTAFDRPLPGFSLSPARSKKVVAFMRKHRAVTARIESDGRLYKDSLPIPVAEIKGRISKTVLALGHAYEQGANDNSSGMATLIESARVLNGLIKKGVFPNPRRTIRFMAVAECYGTLAFAQKYRAFCKNTVAAINVDCVAGRQKDVGMPMRLFPNPHASTAFTDVLSTRILEALGKDAKRAWLVKPWQMGDSLISDPQIGIPTASLGTHDRFWHTTADTIDKIDPGMLSRSVVTMATYLYFIANAGDAEVVWLAQQMSIEAKRAASNKKMTREGLNHLETIARLGFDSLKGLATAGKGAQTLIALEKTGAIAFLRNRAVNCAREKLPAYSGFARTVIPVRRLFGAPSFHLLTEEAKARYDVRNLGEVYTLALFWCNGARTLAEVARLVDLETQAAHGKEIIPFFRYLVSIKYLGLKNKN